MVDLEAINAAHQAATQGEWGMSEPWAGFCAFTVDGKEVIYTAASMCPNPEADHKYLVAAANAWPAVYAELLALRASLASAEERAAKAERQVITERNAWEAERKSSDILGEQNFTMSLEWGTREAARILAEEQRDALAATVAGLRAALDGLKSAKWDQYFGNGLSAEYARAITSEITTALAASPAEHAARIQAAALRKLGEQLKEKYWKNMDSAYNDAAGVLYQEADRLEKAVVA
jgi:hypothetical protein